MRWQTRARSFIASLGFLLLVSRASQAVTPALPLPDDPTHLAHSEHFVFHSSPWLNLHHLLFQWARREVEPAAGDRRRPVEVRERMDGLSAEERALWQSAVSYYAEHVVERHLTFNTELHRPKEALASAGERLPAELPYGVTDELTSLLPIYLRQYRPAHERSSSMRTGCLSCSERSSGKSRCAIWRAPSCPGIGETADREGGVASGAAGALFEELSASASRRLPGERAKCAR